MNEPAEDTWHRHEGIRWVHRPAPLDQRVVAGVVLGRGYGDQQVRHLGVADVVAELLRRELGRPMESSGGVLEASVDVTVDLRQTVVLIAGTTESVQLRMRRLDQLLRSGADPEPPEVPLSRRKNPWAGWSAELGHWFGVGAGSLACEIDGAAPQGNPATRDPAVVGEALRALHPSRGTPAVALSTDASLIGCALSTDGQAAAPGSLLLRERGPESILPTFDNNLLSFAAPASAAGAVAEQILLATLYTAVTMATRTERLEVTAVTVEDRRLVAVRATTEDSYDGAGAHRAVTEAVLACREVAPETIERHLAQARDPEVAARSLGLVALAVRSLWSTEPRRSATLVAETAGLAPEEVRQALAALGQSLVLGIPTGSSAPDGFPVQPRRVPSSDRDDAVLPGRSRHRPLVRVPLRSNELNYLYVGRDGVAATVTTTLTDRARSVRERQLLDLSRLAVRVDLDAVTTLLIDEEDRRARIVWPAITGRNRLQQAVDTVTPVERRLSTGTPESAFSRAVAAQLRLRRRILVGVSIFMVLLVAFIVVMELTVERQQEGTVAQVAEGSTVTLANGTTMAVSDARLEQFETVGSDVLLVEVEVCGGGPTVDDEAGDDARNYVNRNRFELRGTPQGAVGAWPRGTTPLGDLTLAQGQCTQGTVGWMVPAAVPADVTVSYANRFGDVVTWTVSP